MGSLGRITILCIIVLSIFHVSQAKRLRNRGQKSYKFRSTFYITPEFTGLIETQVEQTTPIQSPQIPPPPPPQNPASPSNFPSPMSDEDKKAILAEQNKARAMEGLGPLVWDDTLAEFGRNYVNTKLMNTCTPVHSHGPYAWGWPTLSVQGAVKGWVDEKKYYDHNSNSCTPGQMCGHYTQVAWKSSERVGCAKVFCKGGDHDTTDIIICNYDPPGTTSAESHFRM